jgi:hypothetical protein
MNEYDEEGVWKRNYSRGLFRCTASLELGMGRLVNRHGCEQGSLNNVLYGFSSILIWT